MTKKKKQKRTRRKRRTRKRRRRENGGLEGGLGDARALGEEPFLAHEHPRRFATSVRTLHRGRFRPRLPQPLLA
jgi:hypothetical protein